MLSRLVAIAVLVGCIAIVGAAEPKETMGQKIVAFCAKQKGEQVGNGECSALAGEALKLVGAKGRGKDDPNEGDYTWGKLVLTVENKGELKITGKATDVHPGDIIQFRDTKWAGKALQGNRTYTMSFGHHTAVVASVQQSGRVVNILHQNYNGKKVVQEATLQLDHLKEGWIRIYQPVAK